MPPPSASPLPVSPEPSAPARNAAQELARAQAELQRQAASQREVEERLGLVLDANQAGLWEWDLQTGAFSWTDQVYLLFGLQPGSLQPTVAFFRERLHPEDLGKLELCLRDRPGESAPWNFDFRLLLPDGRYGFFSSRARVLTDKEGRPLRMIGSLSDQTARRQTEETLRLQAQIASQVNDAVVAVDREGRVIYWNPAAERLYGRRSEEMIGQPLSTAYTVAWADPEKEREAREQLETQGAWHGRSVHLLAGERGKVHVESTVNFRLRPDGSRDGLLSVTRDATRELSLEEQVRHSQKLEAIGVLAGGVAHDFNNLLQVVKGYTQLALETDNVHERRAHIVQVQEAAERASQLTRQLLAFGRRQELCKVDTHLNALIEDTVKMISRVIGEHIDVDFNPAYQLGNVRVDRGQINQVLMNLCLNARDAMSQGGRLVLETQNAVINSAFREKHPWARVGRYALVTVSDTGHGMDKETLGRIFEPFFTTKGKDRGTGLGLAVVYGVIQQHDGMLNVYSEPGVGTTFHIYLPVVEPLRQATPSRHPFALHGGSETLLLAEDEPQVRQLARKILERAGYTVLAAADGQEAVELFKAHADKIALLVLDVVMPKLGGRECYETICSLRPGVPAIFCSGYAGAAAQAQSADPFGISAHFLHKPYGAEPLLAKIRQLLDRRPAL